MTPDTLTLSRMHFFGRHGVLPEETARGQNFEVTIQLELPLAEAGRTDDLTLTVDYRAVHAAVRTIMEGPPRKLAEALAEAVAAQLLRVFPLVRAVEVEVIKLEPPVDFTCAGLSVRVRRTRKT